MRLPFTRRSPEDRVLRGFTLVEILLVIAILGIVMAAVAPLMRTVHSAWNSIDRRTEIMQNGRVGQETLTRYIRQAKRITGIPENGSGNYIKFRDANDTTGIVFFHNIAGSAYYILPTATGTIKDNDLVMCTRSSNGTVRYGVLARSLNTFRMDFKDKSGSPATNPADVYSVGVSMGLSDPQGIIAGITNIPANISIRSEFRITDPVWAAGYASSSCLFEVSTDTYSAGSYYPLSVSVNSNTGECWVAEYNLNRVRKISAAGAILVDVGGFNRPYCVSVNSNTGDCWVADLYNNRVVKLSSSGAVLANTGGFNMPFSVSVNPETGECWVADTYNYHIKKLSAVGQVLLDLDRVTIQYTPNRQITTDLCSTSVSVDPDTGECWIALWPSGVIRFSASGQVLSYAFGFNQLRSVSVNPETKECWVADTENGRVKKLSASGAVLADVSGFNQPYSVSVNPSTGQCWVADRGNNRIVALGESGSIDLALGFSQPMGISASH